jgi:hypothetical protein
VDLTLPSVGGSEAATVPLRPPATNPPHQEIYATPDGWFWNQDTLTLVVTVNPKVKVLVQSGPRQFPYVSVTLGPGQSVTVPELPCGELAFLFVNGGQAAPAWDTGAC